MKKTLNTILRIFLGIIIIVGIIFSIFYSFEEYLNIRNLTTLKWIPLFASFTGFYLGGIINRKTKIYLLPILLLSLLIFTPMGIINFQRAIFIIMFSLLGLLLSRKELSIKYKIPTLLVAISIFGYFLFSQPLIIEKKGFGIDTQNNLYNALVLWDFSNGKPSKIPNEVFVDKNGNDVKLSDFKGKDIYITFWATWCGPCLQEKEVLEQLKNNLKNNENLVFIDISIDTNTDAWKAYIEEHDPYGIQLISRKDSKTKSNFKMSAIPHHVAINKDGYFKEFISPHFAKPEILASSDKLNDYINTPYKVFDVKIENGKEVITQVK